MRDFQPRPAVGVGDAGTQRSTRRGPPASARALHSGPLAHALNAIARWLGEARAFSSGLSVVHLPVSEAIRATTANVHRHRRTRRRNERSYRVHASLAWLGHVPRAHVRRVEIERSRRAPARRRSVKLQKSNDDVWPKEASPPPKPRKGRGRGPSKAVLPARAVPGREAMSRVRSTWRQSHTREPSPSKGIVRWKAFRIVAFAILHGVAVEAVLAASRKSVSVRTPSVDARRRQGRQRFGRTANVGEESSPTHSAVRPTEAGQGVVKRSALPPNRAKVR